MGGTWVPITDTFTSKPSSPSSDALSESPDELEDEDPLGGPSVGIDGLPSDDAVDPWLELLELDLEADGAGIDGELEPDELDTDGIDGELELELEEEADGIEGEFELELEEDAEGIEGDELLELELEDEADGIEGEELELLWLVSVLQAARIRLSADAVISALIGNRVTGPFMFCPCRVHDLCSC
jgi:hypothetical protein